MEDIFSSKELMEKFESIYGKNGKINKFIKECENELTDPESFSIHNFESNIKSEDIKSSNNKINNIEKIAQLHESTEKIKEMSYNIKVAQSNQKLIEQCISNFEETNDEKDLSEKDDNFVDSSINYYKSKIDEDLSDVFNSDSLLKFCGELNELTEITKIQIQNLAESMQFQSLSDFYKE